MKASLVQIGNSRGVRIPKAFLKEAGLTEQVDIRVRGKVLEIRALRSPRSGWDEAFAQMSKRGDDALLDMPRSRWDESEWNWLSSVVTSA